MSKFLLFIFILIGFSSCVVSKKKYLTLEQELTQIKADLNDDDNDGIPNYIDLEPKTEALAEVDKQGRTIIIEKIVDMDQDGVLDVNDFCPTIKGIAAANGCPDKDGDGVYDFEDKCPRIVGLDSLKGCPFIPIWRRYLDTPWSGYRIIYKPKTDSFDSLTSTNVDDYLNYLGSVYKRDQIDVDKIQIYSFTDSDLDSLKSIKLSIKRSKKVMKLLVKKGIPEGKIEIIGRGIDERLYDAEHWIKNYQNRSEIIFKHFNE